MESERCTPLSFVHARATLAASLSGANLATLESEISMAEEQTSRWSASTNTQSDESLRRQVLDKVLSSSYTRLQRFQNQAHHCRPRQASDVSAISHLRATDARSETRQLELSRSAARHMLGFTDSPFVSLVEDASRLSMSKDDDERGGAKAITLNSRELHTYMVPRSFTWRPQDVSNILDRGTERADQHYRDWLSETPTEESEVLFLGGNLDQYRTAAESNPYRTQRTRDSRRRK